MASWLSTLLVSERASAQRGIAIPGAATQLVARFGASSRGGLDVHAMGGRQKVMRKTLAGEQRTVAVRLRLGAAERVLGVPDAAMAGRVVALEDLWGAEPTQRLYAQLAAAPSTLQAARVLEVALAERVASTPSRGGRSRLVLEAANRLARANVNAVADELGMSERHLRRVFLDAVGVAPKQFAKIARFGRAVSAARVQSAPSWAGIAADAGYYDQAHLIAEFRAIAGVTPRALLGELQVAESIG